MSTEFTTGPLVLEEMIKIVSLMENPSAASHVRKALCFYDIPQGLQYQWGNNDKLMAMLRHYELPQNPEELTQMLKLIQGKRSLLEIGSSFGGTLKYMASVMPRGSKVVVVDLACDDTPKFLNPLATLRENCRKLALLGANVELFIGDSHDKATVEGVKRYAPFDFVFIDGDHSYEGVKQDWENYGPMGKMVGFHDVFCLPDVKRLWDEIKETGVKTEEYVATQEPKFGIGIVFKE